MQITVESIIAADRLYVWKAFENPDNLTQWQPTLCSRELIAGVSGQAGSEALLTYNENGHIVEMRARITARRAPEAMHAIYETPVAKSTVENIFSPLDDGSTRWRQTCEYRFIGLLPRLLSRCLRGTISRRIKSDMMRFKNLVENQSDLRRVA